MTFIIITTKQVRGVTLVTHYNEHGWRTIGATEAGVYSSREEAERTIKKIHDHASLNLVIVEIPAALSAEIAAVKVDCETMRIGARLEAIDDAIVSLI